MPAELRLTRRLQHSYEKPDRTTREHVRKAVGELAENPLLGRPLKGQLDGEWSLRVGAYRIPCSVDGNIAWIETVRHRREVYR